MSIVSYAQNFEDVMLWRALKHVENGFYIDIGANEPTIDSVSKTFYEKGWRGVHVEPSPEFSEKLKIERPDETVEQVLISNQVGEIKFYQIEGTGLSTADYEVAKKHETAGFAYKEITVPSISLDSLLQRYGDREIHWLKIDVEGYEESVLDSWENSKIRPWILVIESTQPLSTIESHHDWERRVINKGYAFAYFDGLNRFYIHESKSKLISCFSTPPNVFDGFTLSGQASNAMCSSVLEKVKGEKLAKEQAEAKASEAEAKASEAEAKASEAEAKASEAEAKASEAEAKASEAAHQLHIVLNSTSLKITAPLRKLMHALLWFKNGVLAWLHFKPHSRPRRIAKSILLKLKSFVARSPKLKNLVLILLKPFPSLSSRLRRVGQANFHVAQYTMPQTQQDLSPRAKQIYAQLKQAIEQNNKESA